MTSEHQLDSTIDSIHRETERQLLPHIQRAHPDVSPQRLRAHLKTRPKDDHPHKKSNYYVPIFSTHPGAFQMDLLIQSKDETRIRGYPPCFLVLVNVNTKKAYVRACPDKTDREITDRIKEIITTIKDKHRPIYTITSDGEGAFQRQAAQTIYDEYNIKHKVIDNLKYRHTVLSVVDRFIRTLRDMNRPGVNDDKQSHEKEFRDFSTEKMAEFVRLYNNTIHNGTGYTPNEMEADRSLEEKYIIKKLYELERRKKIKDFNLEVGTYVRFILPKDPKKKQRYKVSPEAYKIAEKDGNSYVIEAADHNRITVPRWRIFPLGPNLPPKIKFAATIKVKNEGDTPANQTQSAPESPPVQTRPATIAATEVSPPQPVRRNPSRIAATHRRNLADTNPILL